MPTTTSTTHVSFLVALYIFFLALNFLCMSMANASRVIIPRSAPSTVTRPMFLPEEEAESTLVMPDKRNNKNVFNGRQVSNCLPKGFRHNSAPSRFVNYDTLSCSGIMHSKNP
ncbi:hypothetical protein HN51_033891 [Arachis hypogaea]|uniref:Transmembrane protein n=1 Tax=Arachis hypogaea TaxID=3818 RepID=A0A445AA33_ARAHY|nr:uncharacterized protein DS421_13g391300 [Arachis hypogaea]RYR23314.1 hypothetical protein Ahy_B03g068557 [Arachis hypogaea]